MNIDYKVAEVELSYKPTKGNKPRVRLAKDAYNILLPTFNENTIHYKEYFKVLYLNGAQEVIAYTQISEGGITETIADLRIIFQAALLTNAVAIILAHNHPSGNLTPSREDMRLTEEIKNAAKIMRITVLDHIIMDDVSFYSFADEGRI